MFYVIRREELWQIDISFANLLNFMGHALKVQAGRNVLSSDLSYCQRMTSIHQQTFGDRTSRNVWLNYAPSKFLREQDIDVNYWALLL